MIRVRTRFLIIAALLCCALPLSAQEKRKALTPATAAAIDTLFSAYSHSGSPGCAVGVYQDGVVAFARGYGFANLTHDVPITPSTRFTVGSVSKQFTAASIALLARAGRLSLDDDVHKYLPELATYGAPVTIRQLVHHTSGLRDFWELVDLAGMRNDDGYGVNDMLMLAARQQGLNFPPGSEYRYSNTGYLVLGAVVQRVTGQSLRRFADSAIFTPLGMRETFYLDDHNEIVTGRAAAYSPLNGGWRVSIWNNDLVGQGGVVTSLADLQKWDENFYSASLGGPPFLELVQSTDPLTGGKPNPYAFGLEIGQYRGVKLVSHTGSTGGYRAALYRFPQQHTSMAMLCNASTANTASLSLRMADIVLRSSLGPADSAARRTARAAEGRPAIVPGADRTRLAGRYVSSELFDSVWELTSGPASTDITVSRLRHDPVRVRATVTPNVFSNDDASLVLTFDVKGAAAATGFRLDGSRVTALRFTRASP